MKCCHFKTFLSGGKVIAAPFLGALAICAGALAVGISLFVWPIYGGILLHKHCESRKTTKAVRRQPPPTNPRNVLYLP
ncbi:hypothetical protein TNIN_138691 [Trichonephila inaurata madagascariensis]|uniref:Transmembrane protein n=1 Tax=Trichonephila inaurata madagascariensis TaxID=2747483 RepID=A0A8X6MFB2_9ARAC|nr:hypothetical protein TNIN_138691 [Trichonephila inaurata madagascariensis]